MVTGYLFLGPSWMCLNFRTGRCGHSLSWYLGIRERSLREFFSLYMPKNYVSNDTTVSLATLRHEMCDATNMIAMLMFL